MIDPTGKRLRDMQWDLLVELTCTLPGDIDYAARALTVARIRTLQSVIGKWLHAADHPVEPAADAEAACAEVERWLEKVPQL